MSVSRLTPFEGGQLLVADSEWESLVELPEVGALFEARVEEELWERLARVRNLKMEDVRFTLAPS